MANIIKVDEKEKASSIRVSNKTREMLSALAKGQESQEEIILRLIRLANNLSSEGTKVIEEGNATGTKYAQKNRTLQISLKNKKYSVVCTYNDLSVIAIMQHKQLQNMTRNPLEWELDLEIINISKGTGWLKPSTLKIEEVRIIYLICVKQILEETFDIKLYELLTEEEYLDENKWVEAYNRNSMSRDSLNSDIRSAFRSDLKEKLR